MVIVVADIGRAVQRARACFTAAEVELNAADAKLGDGDTGGMLRRLADGIAKVDLSHTEDVGIAFTELAKAASASTGSSLGTLVMTAFMTLAKATRGQTEIASDRLPELISGICSAMLSRGGAALGDKTVIDGLDAVAKALRAAEPAIIQRLRRRVYNRRWKRFATSRTGSAGRACMARKARGSMIPACSPLPGSALHWQPTTARSSHIGKTSWSSSNTEIPRIFFSAKGRSPR